VPAALIQLVPVSVTVTSHTVLCINYSSTSHKSLPSRVQPFMPSPSTLILLYPAFTNSYLRTPHTISVLDCSNELYQLILHTVRLS
jgi:hypothetical protein